MIDDRAELENAAAAADDPVERGILNAALADLDFDRYREIHGTSGKGARANSARLTEGQVEEIRLLVGHRTHRAPLC